ncbi:MAG: hypothetical protein ACOX1U_09810 [Saccharofermentanales bacterium]|jgi:hypothetical protein
MRFSFWASYLTVKDPGAAAVSPLMYSNPDLTKREIIKHTSFTVLLYIVIGCVVFPVLDAILS